jgi:hypothetical protein
MVHSSTTQVREGRAGFPVRRSLGLIGQTLAHYRGAATKADLVEIRWPDRTTTELRDVPADQQILKMDQEMP